MKSILITGANGFLGRALCNKLTGSYFIFPVTRTLGTDLEGIFKNNKVDYIIHAATFYGREYEGATEFIESNIMLPLKACEYGIKYGSEAFINTDTFLSREQGYDYLVNYIRSKRQVNEWLQELSKKIPVINMQIQHMYGPGDRKDKFIPQLIEQLIAGKDIPLTAGEQKRDFIYIDDVVNAYQHVLDSVNIRHFRKVFTELSIGTGDSISIFELVNKLHLLTNSKSKLLFGALPYRKGEIMDSKAYWGIIKVMKWRPRTTLEEGLKKTIANE